MQKRELWGWISRPFAAGLAAGVLLLTAPLLAVEKSQAAQVPELLPANPAASETPGVEVREGWDRGRTVDVLLESGQVEQMTMAEYLWRVVAAEMPATFEVEALRAQAVCARTYTLWKMGKGQHEGADLCDDSACCQAYTTHQEAEERWGDLAEAYTHRIMAAVEDTDGQVLVYEGKPIQAVFFSSSISSTEDAAEVWGSSLPYLVPVDSPEGEEVPNYHSTVVLTAEELRQLVQAGNAGITLSGDSSGWIGDVSYNSSGRVASLRVGSVTLSGGAARSLFGLRSACFEVEESDGVFTFSVTGYGHGVGMSQYGANAMAKKGSTWEEIVQHYYTGITIQQGV